MALDSVYQLISEGNRLVDDFHGLFLIFAGVQFHEHAAIKKQFINKIIDVFFNSS